MSAIKIDNWSKPAGRSNAAEKIRGKLAAVSSKLDAYYAGRSEAVSAEDAASLRGEQRAYHAALAVVEGPAVDPSPEPDKATSD